MARVRGGGVRDAGARLELLDISGCDAVFCGDSYLPGVAVYARFPKSDKAQAAASEQLILELACGRVMYPGHGEVVDGRVCCGDE